MDLVAPGAVVTSTFLTSGVQAQSVELDDAGERVRVEDEPPMEFFGAATWSGASLAAADATGETAKVALAGQCTAQRALAIIRGRESARRYSVHQPARVRRRDVPGVSNSRFGSRPGGF